MLEVARKGLSMALKGDRSMIKFFLERFLPPAATVEVEDGQTTKITFNVRTLELGKEPDIIDVTPEKLEESIQS